MEIVDWVIAHVKGIDDVRDAFYILVAIPALILLWWRSASADRQARAALRQAKAAYDQSVLAQADSVTGSFLSATDMLGSEVAAVRVGGVHSLTRLAEQRPEEFHVRVMQLFCAFLNDPPPHAADPPPSQRDDLQTILQVLKRRSDAILELEKKQGFYIHLTMAQLSGSALRGSKFSRAHIVQGDVTHAYAEGTDFSHSRLDHCDLRHGRFVGCNFFLSGVSYSDLSDSSFRAANFHRASLYFVNLSTSNLKFAKLTRASISAVDFRGADLELADLSGARIGTGRRLKPDGEIDNEEVPCILTQAQLDEAAADPAQPPEIDPKVLDAETGQKLAWNEERGRQNWERLEAQRQASLPPEPEE